MKQHQFHSFFLSFVGQYNMGGDPKPQVDIIKEKVYMGNQKARDSHLGETKNLALGM